MAILVAAQSQGIAASASFSTPSVSIDVDYGLVQDSTDSPVAATISFATSVASAFYSEALVTARYQTIRLSLFFPTAFTDDVFASDLLETAIDRGYAFSDIVVTSDTATFLQSKVFSDTVVTSDAMTRVLGKVLADTVTSSETLAKNISTCLSDTVTSSDSLFGAIGGGHQWNDGQFNSTQFN